MSEKDVKSWINEWCDLWPEGVVWNNVPIKSKPEECVNRMVKFCKDNPLYKKDTIFAATEAYLEEKEADDWNFTRRSNYFIDKRGEASLLEIFCNKIIENSVSVSKPSYSDTSNFNSDWI